MISEEQQIIRNLKAALREVEFGSCDGCGGSCYCHWCSNHEDFDYDIGREETGHLPDCPVGSALAEGEEK